MANAMVIGIGGVGTIMPIIKERINFGIRLKGLEGICKLECVAL